MVLLSATDNTKKEVLMTAQTQKMPSNPSYDTWEVAKYVQCTTVLKCHKHDKDYLNYIVHFTNHINIQFPNSQRSSTSGLMIDRDLFY